MPRAPTPNEATSLGDDNANFRLLVDSVADYGIFMLDAEGYVATWNLGAEKLKGYTADEIVGEHFSKFYPPEDVAAGKPARALFDATRNGRVEDEGWRVRKDGTRFWALVVLTALHDDEGKLIGFAKVTRDLTERRNTEEALRRSEERLRLMVETARDYAIFMVDPQGCVASWNVGAARLDGYAASEILGKSIAVFYPPEDIAVGKHLVEVREATRNGRFEDEGWRVRKDGTRFWANVVLTALHDAGGTLVGFVKITRDLTDRRRAEEERVHRARAEESVRLRDEFLSIASHELRTPLQTLRIQADSLSRAFARASAPTPERVQARVLAVRRELGRLESLVEDLLDVTRITAGRLELRREPIDLGALAHTVVNRLKETAKQSDAEITVTTTGNVWGNWDATRIEQVVLNLLTNATKYGKGQPIDVMVADHGAEVLVTIRDRGIGIDQDVQERIFERFERASDVRHFGGLGLGLWITRQIVDAHSGRIKVSSTPGEGSTFCVWLPREVR